jgi:hypothetical protein
MRPYHKTAWTCVIIATFILFFYTFSFAQTEGIKGVQFKDGNIIYGRVIEMNVYDIRIETKDGEIISRKFEDVANFIQDSGVDAKQEVKQAPVAEKILQAENIQGVRFSDYVGVRFNDGSVIYGTIIELNTDKVIILTKDNETITKKYDDVASFIKADEKESPKTLSKSRHTWEIGPEISYIEYKEPDVMSEKGLMYGIGVAYTYRNGVMIKVAGRYSYGQVDYDGTGTINNIRNDIFEIRLIEGYDFKISSSFTMTPFFGFGYRYLRDDMAGRISSTGNKGYLRESNYFYSPIGIEAVHVFDKGWSTGVILEYDYFLLGKQKSYLSGVLAGINDIENNQKSGYGLRGSIIIKKQTDRVFYVIEPFIRYWNIDKSDVQDVTYSGTVIGTAWEPKNQSTEIGVKFMIGF